MCRKTSTFLVLLFVVSFAVRAAFVCAMRDPNKGPCGIASADDVEFNNLALRVSRGEGYVNDQGLPTSFRAPGWPLFLAGVYTLAGPCIPLVYVALCGLGALACVLTYLLARELVPEGTARIAGVMAAFYLPHVYFSAGFLSEGLFVPCLTLGGWLFLLSLRRDSRSLLILAGLAFSWATLTRPFALLLWPILLAVLVIAQGRRKGPRLLPAMVFSFAFFACVAPWTLRNQQVHGRFVLVATNGGSTFYGGNNERVAHEFRRLGSWISTTELPHRDWVEATPTEVAHDQMEWKLGIDWLREHPGSVPLLGVYKVARLCLWLPDFDGGSRWFLCWRILGYVPFLLLILIGMAGCVRQRVYRQPAWLVVHGVMLATLGTALVFWGSPRFRDANLSFLMIYAALGWTKLWRRQNVNEPKRGLLTPQVNLYTPNGCVVQREAPNRREEKKVESVGSKYYLTDVKEQQVL